MYVGAGSSGLGSYHDTMSGAGEAETLSSLSEKSDTYFISEHNRNDLEVVQDYKKKANPDYLINCLLDGLQSNFSTTVKKKQIFLNFVHLGYQNSLPTYLLQPLDISH